MYVNKNKLFIYNLISVAMIILGVFFSFIFLLAVCLEFTNDILHIDNIIITGLAAICCVIILIIGIHRIKFSGNTNKFNNVFENDPDGVLFISKISQLFGMTEQQFTILFHKLTKKGFLINCSLENQEDFVIVLNNGGETVEDKFDIVQCPNCGGNNQIKIGFVQECRFCGSKVSNIKKHWNILFL